MKDWLGYAIYRTLSGLFGLLPEPAVRHLGSGAGRIASFILPERKRLIRRHLERVTGEAPSGRLVRDAFASYGRYWAEVFWIRPRRKAQFVDGASVEGMVHVRAAADAGNGLIMGLMHSGNWEVAGSMAEEVGLKALAVVEGLNNERIVAWFKWCRESMGIDVVVARKGSSVTRDLLRKLKDGGMIALVSDRDISGKGIPVLFFGEETTMPAGPASLADKTGAALLPVGNFFNDGPGHRIVVGAPVEMPRGITGKNERIAEITQRLANAYEDLIRQRPQDWHIFMENWASDVRDTS
jgi:phosphatidylinositol dimannoside acyltransferase